jgi:hypothetical protein
LWRGPHRRPNRQLALPLDDRPNQRAGQADDGEECGPDREHCNQAEARGTRRERDIDHSIERARRRERHRRIGVARDPHQRARQRRRVAVGPRDEKRGSQRELLPRHVHSAMCGDVEARVSDVADDAEDPRLDALPRGCR